jgi:hypothetical protein
MAIYSGIDADAFNDAVSPNYALKELQIDLAAPFSRTPESGCAPNCSAPTSSGVGAGGTGLGGSPTAPTFAQCALSRPAPKAWVRGKVYLLVTTSVATGVHATVTSSTGRVLGQSVEPSPGHLRIPVDTRLLPSNRRSIVVGDIFVNAARACGVSANLNVDNVKAKVRLLRRRGTQTTNYLTLRANETVRVWIKTRKHRYHTYTARAGKSLTLRVPHGVRHANVIAVDRAGNRTVAGVSWR